MSRADLDNDGDEDDSDEYLHHKLSATNKHAKKESVKPTRSLKDIKSNIVGTPALGQFVRKFKK